MLASRKHETPNLWVARDLIRRVHTHKTKAVPGFASRYGVDRLVWFEAYHDPGTAIARGRLLKNGGGIAG